MQNKPMTAALHKHARIRAFSDLYIPRILAYFIKYCFNNSFEIFRKNHKKGLAMESFSQMKFQAEHLKIYAQKDSVT